MSNFRLTFLKILWGPGLASTLTGGYWLDNVTTWDEPRQGSEQVQAPSGVEDAWTVGTDYYLEGDLCYIPAATTTTVPSGSQTGWDGAAGVRAFLAWARDKNVFTFYPDQTNGAVSFSCYLVDPMNGAPTVEADGTRRVKIKIRNSTAAFDGY